MKSTRFLPCPNCQTKINELTEVKYNSPFICPKCSVVLHVPIYYSYLGFVVGVAADFAICFAMKLKGLGFILGLVLFFFPVGFSIGIFQRKLFPPKLVID